MELTIYISRGLGVAYLTVGIGLFIHRELYILSLRQLANNHGLVLLSGFVAIFGGMALVTWHNLWTTEWPVLVTIIGWTALAKGILLLLAPNYIQLMSRWIKVQNGLGLTILLITLGMLFTYFGFIHPLL